MTTTTAGTPISVENAAKLHDLMPRTVAEGEREFLDSYGATLVYIIKEGNCEGSANVLAAALDLLRDLYRRKFTTGQAPARYDMPADTTNDSAHERAIRLAAPLDADHRETAGRQRVEIPQGTFTVVFPDGTYETIKLETVTSEGSNFFGKTIASYLSGPDNSRDFQGFAFVGEFGEVKVWNRFSALRGSHKVMAVINVIGGNDEGRADAREAYALRSGRCARCGHKLTVPASIHRGLGPDCAGMI